MEQSVPKRRHKKNSDAGDSPERKNTAETFFHALLSTFRETYQKLRNNIL